MKCSKRESGVATALLALFLVFMEQGLYLIDTDAINVAGVFNYDIIWMILFVIYLAWLLNIMIKKKIPLVLSSASSIVLLILIMCFYAAFSSNFYTGQPVIKGLVPQRGFILVLASVYVLYPAIKAKIIEIDRFFDYVLALGVIACCLYLLQVALSGSFQFLHVGSNERYGFTRLYTDSVFCIASGLIGFERILKTRKIAYFIPVVLLFAYELIVSKGRLELMSVLIAILVCLMMEKKAMNFKIWIIFVLFVLTMVFLASDYGLSIIDAFFNQNASMETRLQGRELYWKELSSDGFSLVFGCGYPNTLYDPAAYKAGFFQNVYLADNGIYGFTYVYGLLGLLLIVVLWLYYAKNSLRVYRTQGKCFYVMFFVLNLCLAQNITWWWLASRWTLMMVIVFCAAESEKTKTGLILQKRSRTRNNVRIRKSINSGVKL